MKEDIYNAAYFINKTRNKTPPPPPPAAKPPLNSPTINISPPAPPPRQKSDTEIIDRAKVENRSNTLQDKLKLFENVEQKSFMKTETSENHQINTLQDKLKLFGNIEKKSFTKTETSEVKTRNKTPPPPPKPKTPNPEIRLPKSAIQQSIGRKPNQMASIADRVNQFSNSSSEIVEKSKVTTLQNITPIV